MMPNYYYFGSFNPLKDIHENLLWKGIQPNSALELLDERNRNIEDVCSLLKNIHEYFYQEPWGNESCKNCFIGPIEKYKLQNISYCQKCFIGPEEPDVPAGGALVEGLLWEMEDDQHPTSITSVNSATWEELFAVLALAIHHSISVWQEYHTRSKGQDNDFSFVDFYFSSAAKSIYSAEFILDMLSKSEYSNTAEILYQVIKRKNASVAGKAGGAMKAKNSRYTPLKKKVIEIYKNQYNTLSALKAANIIVNELASEEVEVIVLGNEVERIQKWILNYKKTSPKICS